MTQQSFIERKKHSHHGTSLTESGVRGTVALIHDKGGMPTTILIAPKKRHETRAILAVLGLTLKIEEREWMADNQAAIRYDL